jgi:hypothetical protein
MFGWFRKKPAAPPAATDAVVSQPPGEVFAWPKGVVITAVDEVIIALPVALFDQDRPIGEFVLGPEDMGFSLPPGSDVFFIKLSPGMSVSLAKSCQAYLVAEDKQPRRLKISGPGLRA